jgi:NADH:ubiquinone reductase (non-electrogenic)
MAIVAALHPARLPPRRRAPRRITRCAASPPASPPPPPLRTWPSPRSWNAVALSKLLDTVEDVALIARRTLAPNYSTSLRAEAGTDGGGALDLRSSRPVVLILGSGWAAHSLMKVIDTDAFEVVVVSPRNHFVFTPMIPSSAVGTVEFRSLLEPVRVANPCVTYLEASCTELDTVGKVALCAPAAALPGGARPPFRVAYDVAVVACGEAPATLGVPGVAEHCFFLKEVSDAAALRRRVGECFDLAALPGTPDATRDDLLHFVVVGGGPTGVEFAATLAGA